MKPNEIKIRPNEVWMKKICMREQVESSWYGPWAVGGAHRLVQAGDSMGQAQRCAGTRPTAHWASLGMHTTRENGHPGPPRYRGP